MIAAVDTGALLKLLYASLLAGVGVTVVFSLAILGATRYGELRRAGRGAQAAAYGALAAVALAIAAGAVVYGLILVARK